MKNKKQILAVVAIVLVIAAMAAIYFFTRPEAQAGQKAFTVTVVHADGTENVLQYSTDAEFLGQYLLDQKLIEGEEGPYGLYIQKVDGESAVYEVDGAYWSLEINGEYATQGIDLTPIEDGAAYRLVYTIG